MKSLIVHYKNKYPGAHVQASDNSLDVYDSSGEHVVALRKNGAGMLVDASEEFGCPDRHCLAPIPKNARVHKIIDGKVSLDDKAAERIEKRKDLLRGNKILSEQEYEAEAAAKAKSE